MVKELKNRDVFRALRLSLDYGGSELIAFYLENGMDLLIIDDKEAILENEISYELSNTNLQEEKCYGSH